MSNKKSVPHVRCICGKRGFADEHMADKALGRARAKRTRGVEGPTRRGMKIESRYYQCDRSDAWHLTEQSRRTYDSYAGRLSVAA